MLTDTLHLNVALLWLNNLDSISTGVVGIDSAMEAVISDNEYRRI